MFAASSSTCPGPCREAFWLTKSLRQTKSRTSAPLSFHGPIRGPVSRLPACPDLMPVVATGSRVGVQITRRNRQDLDRRYAGFRSLHYFVDEKIVNLGHFLTIGALYFDLAAKMVVG